ncbi:uncharacterized protein LOC143657378 [Tamandua tetradactyla]|uniref:uncharacterized protein LOC143657378 n=1 Tax=Tamandua tetradactyla TaxID=48850 RepID=UPI004053D3D0
MSPPPAPGRPAVTWASHVTARPSGVWAGPGHSPRLAPASGRCRWVPAPEERPSLLRARGWGIPRAVLAGSCQSFRRGRSEVAGPRILQRFISQPQEQLFCPTPHTQHRQCGGSLWFPELLVLSWKRDAGGQRSEKVHSGHPMDSPRSPLSSWNSLPWRLGAGCVAPEAEAGCTPSSLGVLRLALRPLDLCTMAGGHCCSGPRETGPQEHTSQPGPSHHPKKTALVREKRADGGEEIAKT